MIRHKFNTKANPYKAPHKCAICTYMIPKSEILCDLHKEETPKHLHPTRPINRQVWAQFYDYWRHKIECGYVCPLDREMKPPRPRLATDFQGEVSYLHQCFIDGCNNLGKVEFLMCYRCHERTPYGLRPHAGMKREDGYAKLQAFHERYRDDSGIIT